MNQRSFKYLKCNGCSLIRADFRGSDLSGAQLNDTNLSWTDLTGAMMEGTKMEDSDLAQGTLNETTIIGADFSGIDLSNAQLKNSEVWDADFDSAIMTGIELSGTKFLNTILRNTQISPPDGEPLSGVKVYSDMDPNREDNIWPLYGLDNAAFEGYLDDVHFCNISGENIKMNALSADKVTYKNILLDFVKFQNADLNNIGFFRARLAYVDLSGSTLTNVTWSYRFASSKFEQVDVTGTKWVNTELPPALKSAMCISPEAKDGFVVLPEFDEEDNKPQTQWRVCQKVEETFIPCEDSAQLNALREKLAKRKQKTCTIGGEADYRTCL